MQHNNDVRHVSNGKPANLPCGRERKKAKAVDLEKTVAALSEQLQSMAGVKQENSELQDRNLALVNRLRSKEEELERMLREQARSLERCKRVACRTDDVQSSLVSAVKECPQALGVLPCTRICCLLATLICRPATRDVCCRCTPCVTWADRTYAPDLVALFSVQAAQPAYIKTGSGRVVELAGADEAETSVKEVESLSNTYQATVHALRCPAQPCTLPVTQYLSEASAPPCAAGVESALRWLPYVGGSAGDRVLNVALQERRSRSCGPCW